jgi:hypothetical protein
MKPTGHSLNLPGVAFFVDLWVNITGPALTNYREGV